MSFRRIRDVRPARAGETRSWFQDDYFDLFVIQAQTGRIRWFQLCYRRDSWQELVLEWRRGAGFMHLKTTGGADPARKDAGGLVPDGALPYGEVVEKFDRSAATLPADMAAFIRVKVGEFARPRLLLCPFTQRRICVVIL